ncbi:hypothetical protein Misp01_63330 [Microtetraspora sp. NBRC 13810]|uniref:hypothetical protein n=1 Tax=Microtetraspora sp. NBRC 13810 TaxID=3030990 RepID=UPI0024A13BD6|nr:hypothetical protein [Microtetraspora sp. NBRC 13810]GLW11205.1 hypothetical protein Misp01_63330 [Microtetraspora sp. NBRC 13810]
MLLIALGAVAVPPAHADGEQFMNLVTYYNWDREDNYSAVTAADHARETGYQWIRTKEAWVLARPTDTSTQKPLVLYYNSERGDYMSTATTEGIASAESAGYVRKGVQAYIYRNHEPGTVPLYQYWSWDRQDNFAAASPEGIASAESAEYVRVRVEGYVRPGSDL